jgi:hypothetical protein
MERNFKAAVSKSTSTSPVPQISVPENEMNANIHYQTLAKK